MRRVLKGIVGAGTLAPVAAGVTASPDPARRAGGQNNSKNNTRQNRLASFSLCKPFVQLSSD
jgi:hypothetical protein